MDSWIITISLGEIISIAIFLAFVILLIITYLYFKVSDMITRYINGSCILKHEPSELINVASFGGVSTLQCSKCKKTYLSKSDGKEIRTYY